MADDNALIELGETASSLADFVRFLNALHEDCVSSGEKSGNQSLPDFLEALGAWAVESASYYRNMKLDIGPEQPQWRVFSDMLLAARVYE